MGDLAVDEDVRREVEFHIAMRARELVQEGWEPAAAREEAQRIFGDRDDVEDAMKKETKSRDRSVRRARFLEGVWQDLRFAGRGFLKDPGFTVVALLTLALGIGANAAVFSAVDGILLRPLPHAQPDELVWVAERHREGYPMSVAWANARDWAETSTAFEGITAYNTTSQTVLGGERPVRARLAFVSRDFWRVFPVDPVSGRLTAPEEHVAGGAPVGVIREDLWRQELGSRDPGDLRIEVAGIELQVVGVVPADFRQPSDARLWVPAELNDPGESRSSHNYTVVGRLADGVSKTRAHEELDALTRRLVEDDSSDPDFLATGVVTLSLHERVVGNVRRPLLLMLGAALAVLLVACTNLASTLLARGETRRRELAVRSALGAGRGRIVGQLLTEGVLLATMGGVLGLVAGWGLLEVLLAAEPGSLPRLDEVGLDGRAVLFTAGVTVATALLFSLFPALRLTRAPVVEDLREGGRGGSPARAGVWKVLVGTEVALAIFLLVGSGLLLRSFQRVLDQEPGFDGSDVTTAQVSLSQIRYPSGADHARFYDELVRELEARPGVEAAGVGQQLPLAGFLPTGQLELDGDMSSKTVAGYVQADAGYFEALDIPLLRGRLFDDRDGLDDAHVAVVSESFARENWPGEDPLGKQVSGGGMDSFWEPRPFATVVGVVGDVRYRDLTRPTEPTVYFPISQRNARIGYGASVVLEVSDPDAVSGISLLRTVLSEADPDIPIRVAPMAEQVASSVAQRRFVLGVLGGFALVALLLAAIGIYGVVSWTVARSRKEMGIRLALGAEPGSVRARVVGRALAMVAGGLVVGVLASLVLGSLFESLLFGVDARDPVTLIGVPLVLLSTAVAASWIPAHRTTRIDPSEALQAE